MTKNVNRVPKKAWLKWTQHARTVFNRCYDFHMNNQEVVKHPKTPMLPPAQWKTVAWNAAWIAADACDKTVPGRIVNV